MVGKGNKEAIENRIEGLKLALDLADEEYDKEILTERLAKLSGGVGIIRIGGTTETEIAEKKMRVEDALCATRAAIEEGIVAGGGTVYIDIIEKIKEITELNKEEEIGRDVVIRAMEEPLKQIAFNAGINGEIILEKVRQYEEGIGYDVTENKFVDMKEKGIIDPAKVSRCALENAASIASLIITTEAMIVQDKEKDDGEKHIPYEI